MQNSTDIYNSGAYMELRQIENFVRVSEFANLSQAAGALFISQPALSRQILSLERELGVRLFNRDGRNLSLTDAGEVLLKQAQRVLSELYQTRLLLDEVKKGESGIVRITAAPHLFRYIVVPAMVRFKQIAPAVDVQIVEAHYSDVLSLLDSGEAHLAIASPMLGTDNLEWETLYIARLYALVAPTHPLAASEFLTVDDLAHERLLMIGARHTAQIFYQVSFQMVRLDPRSIVESYDPDTILMLAENSFGVALLPDSIPFAGYKLKALPLVHAGHQLQTTSMIAWHCRRPPSESCRRFINTLKAQVELRKLTGYVPWEQTPSLSREAESAA